MQKVVVVDYDGLTEDNDWQILSPSRNPAQSMLSMLRKILVRATIT